MSKTWLGSLAGTYVLIGVCVYGIYVYKYADCSDADGEVPTVAAIVLLWPCWVSMMLAKEIITIWRRLKQDIENSTKD
jgi:hypothetical protein